MGRREDTEEEASPTTGGARTRASSIEKRLTALVEPVIAQDGYELVAVELGGGGGRQTLRVFIDRPGGITVDHCSDVSRTIDALLEVEDPIAGAYELEVSSPGLDRPLVKPADFERFKGKRARVKTYAPLAEYGPRKVFDGKLAGYADGKVEVEVDGAVMKVPHQSIAKAHLVFELNPKHDD